MQHLYFFVTYDDFVSFDGDLLSILHMVTMYTDTYLWDGRIEV
jgi:hypothetical protein